MKKHLTIVVVLCLALPFIITSCCKDDAVAAPTDDYAYVPTTESDLQTGVYTYSDISEDYGYFLFSTHFNNDNTMDFYIEDSVRGQKLEVPLTAKYSYNASTGYGEYTIIDSVGGDFFADKSGFLVLFDPDDSTGYLNNALWLDKQNYTMEDLKKTPLKYICEYPDTVGCREYDSSLLFDDEDIMNMTSDAKQEVLSRGDDATQWTVASIASWAFNNLATKAAAAAGSAAMSAIMSQIGIGMGSQIKAISSKLDVIESKLDDLLAATKQILDGQVQEALNTHRESTNDLTNTVDPYFSKVMEEEDSATQRAYLQQFFDMKGTITTANFLDNTLDVVVQNKNIYKALDDHIYLCYPWEEQGYVPRETFRAKDLVCAFEGTLLSMLYYWDTDSVMAKKHLSKFVRYLNMYMDNMVVRDSTHAVSQIAGCKIRIAKTVDKRDFYNHKWIHNGVEYECSYYNDESDTHLFWDPGSFAFSLYYGNDRKLPEDSYWQMGLREDEANTIINFYNGEKSMRDILFNEAKLTMPYTEKELAGKDLYILRGNTCGYDDKVRTGQYATDAEVCFSAYGDDKKYDLRQVGCPSLSKKKGERLWYALWLLKRDVKVFDGWKSYNSSNLWCYPIVER